jgi:hypothetical protein
MSYGFIRENFAAFLVWATCVVIEVSRRGYYDFASRPESSRAAADRAPAVEACATHSGHRVRPPHAQRGRPAWAEDQHRPANPAITGRCALDPVLRAPALGLG